MSLLRTAFSFAAIAALASACSTEDPDAASPIGYDLGDDPGAVEDFLGKADTDVCAPFDGGELSGDDLLVLVSKAPDKQLSKEWAPRDLVPVPDAEMMPGRSGSLRGPVLTALSVMFADAETVGLDLGVRSAYRSYRTQCATFAYKVQVHGLAHAKAFSAEPGRSQHQLGTTLDITSARLGWKLSQAMGDASEGQWLEENAHRFGFALSYPKGHEELTGYAYEPWHFRYIGVEAATEMHDSGLILEEYLRRCDAGDTGFACTREVFPEPIPNDGFVGGACSVDADCASIGGGAFCQTEGYPGGHCTVPCDLYCPDREGFNAPTFCVDDDSSSAAGLCHSRCDDEMFPETGCREGFVCAPRSRPNGAGDADVCVPG